MDPDLNKTFIVLIPKVKNAECITQFRAISLCNVSYKIMSKALANKLKTICNVGYKIMSKALANKLKTMLPYLISESQNASE